MGDARHGPWRASEEGRIPVRLGDAALERLFRLESDGTSSSRVDRSATDLNQRRRAVLPRRAVAHAALLGVTVLSLEICENFASESIGAGSLSSARPSLRTKENQMPQLVQSDSHSYALSFVATGVLSASILGASAASARADAEIVAWGYNGTGQTNSPSGLFRKVAVGGHFYTGFCLGLRPNGALVGWGAVPGGAPSGEFTDVAGCNLSACALRADGSIAWWGFNEAGVGNVPIGRFVEVDGAGANFAARRADATWVIWGDNSSGQVSGAPKGPVSELKVGPWYLLARGVGGDVRVWGFVPSGVDALPQGALHSLWPAHTHAVALRADGSAVCWGSNADGQCDAPGGPFRQIAAGGESRGFSVGLRPDGTLVSWGFNGNGEGNVPATKVSRIVVGEFHGVGFVSPNCPADISGNGSVDGVDLAAVLGAWGTASGGKAGSDIDGDGVVGGTDLALVLGSWGVCPN